MQTGHTELEIEVMKASHIGEVVGVHLDSFPGFFLSFLGPRFLKKLYQNILVSELGIAFVCKSGSRIIGFAAGVVDPRKFYRTMLTSHLPGFGTAVLGTAIRKPSTVWRLISRIRLNSSLYGSGEDNGLLMSIGVSPQWQRHGAASALLRALIDEMKKRRISEIYLSTDRDDNEAANAFYADSGFECLREFETPEHRFMNEYMLDLSSSKAADTIQKVQT